MFSIRSRYEESVIELRTAARRLGLIPYLSRVRKQVRRALGTTGEAYFDRALMANVRPGDVVWDVGANVGVYTTQLSDAVGSAGRVVAFEPFPSCFEELRRVTAGHGNVTPLMIALSDRSGVAPMSAGGDHPHSTINSLFTHAEGETVDVPVASGDELIDSGRAPAPNVIKVDVEGFEEEVLTGLRKLLRSTACRAVLCEVHYSVLEKRGQRQAPSRITKLLRESGYRVRWVDASHIEAVRA